MEGMNKKNVLLSLRDLSVGYSKQNVSLHSGINAEVKAREEQK